jgi:hypothetical protein
MPAARHGRRSRPSARDPPLWSLRRVSNDGKHFLVHSGLLEDLSPITLVMNWAAELEKKVTTSERVTSPIH